MNTKQTTPNPLATTPLYAWHKQAGADMADFGGYEMPLWYPGGAKQEHLAVLTGAGLFDTSHMASLRLAGGESTALLQRCFTKDISAMQTGRCGYGAFLAESGHCLDDAISYKLGENEYMIVVNSGMGEALKQHLEEQKQAGQEASVDLLSPELAKMDIQGPEAARILAEVLDDPESVLQDMVYFSFKGRPDTTSPVKLKDGTPLFISRTGYTGEFGFELFLDEGSIAGLWEQLYTAGQEKGLLPCGLAARDSLRAGAVLPLSHQDIGDWKYLNHPWEFALPWNSDRTAFSKDFIGREALEAGYDRYTLPFVGDNPRKVTTSASATVPVLDEGGQTIGSVLTSTTDMGITWHDDNIVSVNTPGIPEDLKIRGLGCGFVHLDRQFEPGARIMLGEGKRRINATIVSNIRPDRSARKAMKIFF